MTNRRFFLSFADSQYKEALSRIKQQAQNIGVYDEIFVLNESDLNDDYREKYKDVLQFGIRGFGYWCWKSQAILQIMEKMEDGDVLNYADAGCHINLDGKDRLYEYFEITKNSPCGILVFDLPHYLEKAWTKGDLFDYFNARNDKKITETGQICATAFFIRKDSKNLQLVKKWKQTYEDNFSLITDKPSKSPNLKGFIENRHDQSVFSILCKLNNAVILHYLDELEPLCYREGAQNIPYPILAKRDTGKIAKPLPKIAYFLCKLAPSEDWKKRIRCHFNKNFIKLNK